MSEIRQHEPSPLNALEILLYFVLNCGSTVENQSPGVVHVIHTTDPIYGWLESEGAIKTIPFPVDQVRNEIAGAFTLFVVGCQAINQMSPGASFSCSSGGCTLHVLTGTEMHTVPLNRVYIVVNLLAQRMRGPLAIRNEYAAVIEAVRTVMKGGLRGPNEPLWPGTWIDIH